MRTTMFYRSSIRLMRYCLKTWSFSRLNAASYALSHKLCLVLNPKSQISQRPKLNYYRRLKTTPRRDEPAPISLTHTLKREATSVWGWRKGHTSRRYGIIADPGWWRLSVSCVKWRRTSSAGGSGRGSSTGTEFRFSSTNLFLWTRFTIRLRPLLTWPSAALGKFSPVSWKKYWA